MHISYHLFIIARKMSKTAGMELINRLLFKDMALPVVLFSGAMPTHESKLEPRPQSETTLGKAFSVEELIGLYKSRDTLIGTGFADLMSYLEKRAASLIENTNPKIQEPPNITFRE